MQVIVQALNKQNTDWPENKTGRCRVITLHSDLFKNGVDYKPNSVPLARP